MLIAIAASVASSHPFIIYAHKKELWFLTGILCTNVCSCTWSSEWILYTYLVSFFSSIYDSIVSILPLTPFHTYLILLLARFRDFWIKICYCAYFEWRFVGLSFINLVSFTIFDLGVIRKWHSETQASLSSSTHSLLWNYCKNIYQTLS